LKRRRDEEKAGYQALHARALVDFESFLKMIVECYGPHRVYQWGALLHPERFRDYSDIDIGVEGTMSPEAYGMICDKDHVWYSAP